MSETEETSSCIRAMEVVKWQWIKDDRRKPIVRYSDFKYFFDELVRTDNGGILTNFSFPAKRYFRHSDADLQGRKESFGALLNLASRQETMLPELNYFLGVSENTRQPTYSRMEGVQLLDMIIGEGATASLGTTVSVQYSGKLQSTNRIFDKSRKDRPFEFLLGMDNGVIRGWHVGILGMRVGGTRKIIVPSDKAYGRRGVPPDIPPNETLIFKITLLEILI